MLDRTGKPAATYDGTFLPRGEADRLLSGITADRSSFRSGFMLVGGQWTKTPRLVAEFGDGVHIYPDAGPNASWSSPLRGLRDRVEVGTGYRFNYAIVNWYRHGADFTGWHSDKMELHAPGSVIAMVSLGTSRRFEFRDLTTRVVVSSTEVGHGSLLVMGPASQEGYEHSLRPDLEVTGKRVSITLREVLPTPSTCCPAYAALTAGSRSGR